METLDSIGLGLSLFSLGLSLGSVYLCYRAGLYTDSEAL
jgi:hypothetical protein